MAEVAPDIIRIGEIHDLVMAGKLPRAALDYAWAMLWAQRAADAWEARGGKEYDYGSEAEEIPENPGSVEAERGTVPGLEDRPPY